jgi:hypothetical protein
MHGKMARACYAACGMVCQHDHDATAALVMRCWRGMIWLHHQWVTLDASANKQSHMRTEKVAGGCRQMEPS